MKKSHIVIFSARNDYIQSLCGPEVVSNGFFSRRPMFFPLFLKEYNSYRLYYVIPSIFSTINFTS